MVARAQPGTDRRAAQFAAALSRFDSCGCRRADHQEPYPCSLAELMATVPGAEFRSEGIVPTRRAPNGVFGQYSSQYGVIHWGISTVYSACTLKGSGLLSVTVTNVAGPNDDRLQTKDVCECLRHILRILGTLYKFEQTFQFAMGFLRNKDLTIRSELVIKDR